MKRSFCRQALERCPDLVGEWRKLIVDDQNAIVADGDADISARAFEHVNVAGNLRRLHLDFRIVSLRLRRSGKQQQNELATEFSSRFLLRLWILQHSNERQVAIAFGEI